MYAFHKRTEPSRNDLNETSELANPFASFVHVRANRDSEQTKQSDCGFSMAVNWAIQYWWADGDSVLWNYMRWTGHYCLGANDSYY